MQFLLQEKECGWSKALYTSSFLSKEAISRWDDADVSKGLCWILDPRIDFFNWSISSWPKNMLSHLVLIKTRCDSILIMLSHLVMTICPKRNFNFRKKPHKHSVLHCIYILASSIMQHFKKSLPIQSFALTIFRGKSNIFLCPDCPKLKIIMCKYSQ